MYSLNVPVPGEVARRAAEIARDLPEARPRARGEHTLGVKRLVSHTDESYGRLETKTREVLVGQPAFEVRVSAIEYFDEAPTGTSPVVYLTVDSPELIRLHDRLAEVFDPLEEIEGEGYTPHVTVARGGSLERAKSVSAREFEPLTWTVDELVFWDGQRRKPVSSVSLPA